MSSSENKKKKKAHAHTHNEGERHAPAALLQSALFGSVCGLLSAALLLFGATLVCYRLADPNAWMTPLALAALFLSSFVAGFAALKRNRASALLCGGMSGLFLMLFFLALSFFFPSTLSPTFSLPISILIRTLMLPTAAIGGFLGLGKPKKRHP